MTLDYIWENCRDNLSNVTSRSTDPAGCIAVGLESPDAAGLGEEDRNADDWLVYEPRSHDCDVIPHERCPMHGQIETLVLIPYPPPPPPEE